MPVTGASSPLTPPVLILRAAAWPGFGHHTSQVGLVQLPSTAPPHEVRSFIHPLCLCLKLNLTIVLAKLFGILVS